MRPRQANPLRSTKAGAAASARHAPPALTSNLVPCNGSRRRGVGSTAASPEPARGASGLLRVSRSGREFPELAPRGRCITSGCSWPPAASGWRPPSPAAGRASRGSERLRRGPPGGVWSPHGGRAAEPPSVSQSRLAVPFLLFSSAPLVPLTKRDRPASLDRRSRSRRNKLGGWPGPAAQVWRELGKPGPALAHSEVWRRRLIQSGAFRLASSVVLRSEGQEGSGALSRRWLTRRCSWPAAASALRAASAPPAAGL